MTARIAMIVVKTMIVTFHLRTLVGTSGCVYQISKFV